MAGFEKPRKVSASLRFNGKSVTQQLSSCLESVSYTDVASGDSDQLDISLENIDNRWLGKWYPNKGDRVSGSVTFENWDGAGKDKVLSFGTFTLDEIKFSGGPSVAQFGCVSVPSNESFRVRERTKTWTNVTIKKIAAEIAARYSLTLGFYATDVSIASLEQTDKTDCSFLFDLCKTYGMAMKVFSGGIQVYDQTALEKKSPVATLTRQSFVDDNWEYTDSLLGTYTGARISYKSSSSDDEISVYIGLKSEDASGSRVLKINETAGSQSDAYYKAAAKVNQSNEEMTTVSGKIFPNPKICAGVTVKVSGMGNMDGKYFVDKVKITVGSSVTTQDVEMHKCQTRLTYTPKPAASKTASASTSKKEYKIGDIVHFNGGYHYVSSDATKPTGSKCAAGNAKITNINKKSWAKHPYALVHTDSSSRVYGWVDEGTFT